MLKHQGRIQLIAQGKEYIAVMGFINAYDYMLSMYTNPYTQQRIRSIFKHELLEYKSGLSK